VTLAKLVPGLWDRKGFRGRVGLIQNRAMDKGVRQTLTHVGAGAAVSPQAASQPQPWPRHPQPPGSQRASLPQICTHNNHP
jgi:hypothetical protein